MDLEIVAEDSVRGPLHYLEFGQWGRTRKGTKKSYPLREEEKEKGGILIIKKIRRKWLNAFNFY